MATLPAVSREYLYLPGIRAFDTRSPDATTDPTTLPVQVAFLTDPTTQPAETDWHDAEWDSPTVARVLLGAGTSITLTPNLYRVWLRITGAVEQPERPIGSLTIQ